MRAELFGFDLETTGVDKTKDRPVQIGLTQGLGCDPRIIMNSLVDPRMPIAKEAAEVHGISEASLQGMPDYVIGLHTAYELIKAMGGENVILYGFNSSTFDAPMAENCYLPETFTQFPHVDVLDIVYRYYPTLERKKLGEVYEQFLGEELTGAHGAVADCIGTSRLLEYFCETLGRTPAQFAEELAAPIVYPIIPIGKGRGQAVETVSVGWANWMRKHAYDMRPDLKATVDWIIENAKTS